MVTIKFLDDEVYYRHKDLRKTVIARKPDATWMDDQEYVHYRDSYDAKKEVQDKVLDELPVLSYNPAFVYTDENWLKERIRKFAAEHPDLADIECDELINFRASIPRDEIMMCVL